MTGGEKADRERMLGADSEPVELSARQLAVDGQLQRETRACFSARERSEEPQLPSADSTRQRVVDRQFRASFSARERSNEPPHSGADEDGLIGGEHEHVTATEPADATKPGAPENTSLLGAASENLDTLIVGASKLAVSSSDARGLTAGGEHEAPDHRRTGVEDNDAARHRRLGAVPVAAPPTYRGVSTLNPLARAFEPCRALHPGATDLAPRPALHPGATDLAPRPTLHPGATDLAPRRAVHRGAREFAPRAQGRAGEPAPSRPNFLYLQAPPMPVSTPFLGVNHHLRPRAQDWAGEPAPFLLYSSSLLYHPAPPFRFSSQMSRLNPLPNYHFQPPAESARQLLDAVPQRQVRAVWRHNWYREMEYFSSLINQGRRVLIAFDTEYAGAKPESVEIGPPLSTSEWYYRLRSLVNNGDLIQIGLVIQFEDESTADSEAIEINLLYDPSKRNYNPSTIKFLKEEANHDLDEHMRNGVSVESVAQWVRSNLPKLRAATWILFQGDSDMAFLTSLALENFQMPYDKAEFLQVLQETIPRFFDLRVIGLHVLHRESHGFSLSKLGDSLGVRRYGQAHGSGSDAMLTLDCFLQIRRNQGSEINPLAGTLCGIYSCEDLLRLALPADAENTEEIDVWKDNFNKFASFVLSAVECSFNLIALHVELVELEPGMKYTGPVEDPYTSFSTSVNAILTARISVSMGNRNGQLAAGRTCRFNICFHTDPGQLTNGEFFIEAHTFSTCLLSRLQSNERITWITCHGAQSIACVLRCIDHLPSSSDDYMAFRSGIFPILYDVAVVTANRRMTLHEICETISIRAKKSNGGHENDTLLILRCFLKIIGCTDSAHLKNNIGLLLQKPQQENEHWREAT